MDNAFRRLGGCFEHLPSSIERLMSSFECLMSFFDNLASSVKGFRNSLQGLSFEYLRVLLSLFQETRNRATSTIEGGVDRGFSKVVLIYLYPGLYT